VVVEKAAAQAYGVIGRGHSVEGPTGPYEKDLIEIHGWLNMKTRPNHMQALNMLLQVPTLNVIVWSLS
jgi:hypothetical protein